MALSPWSSIISAAQRSKSASVSTPQASRVLVAAAKKHRGKGELRPAQLLVGDTTGRRVRDRRHITPPGRRSASDHPYGARKKRPGSLPRPRCPVLIEAPGERAPPPTCWR